MARSCESLLWSVIWMILLIFVAWEIALFCAGLYIFVSFFTPCVKGFQPVAEFLMKGINFVHFCVRNCLNGTSYSKL
ncbi:hypothetical protein BIW11_05391 [Tropilaelaps mercedesae]|uniref:Uncharacterized protein n=1 Tax=Tropilaelaps mercedesae TaxID=418985 RepID=A0A1V9Y2M2_9ACAR|nr:hypothetical protein BIW11_05391 [Tropilaelaps mercedesae]